MQTGKTFGLKLKGFWVQSPYVSLLIPIIVTSVVAQISAASSFSM